MISKIGTISIFVRDQQRAKDFYTDKLGMELRQDAPLFPGSEARWIAVAPAGSQTELVLYLPDENWDHYRGTVGKSQAITLDVVDMTGTIEVLKSRGVPVVSEPDAQPWGTFATIRDSEGNILLLVEQPQG